MYHTVIQERIRRLHLLHSVMLELTYRCNLNCFYCYNDPEAAGTPLSVDQYLRLFDDLESMQVLFLSFTGGEPLAHPQFFELAGAARRRGFAIRVKSNGHAIRGEVARRLRDEVNPMAVEMSLHGATASVHDRQTRVPGSFERLLENLTQMQQLGLRPSFVSTLTAWNAPEIEAMYALADRFGVRLRWQGPVSPRQNGDREPLTIQPSAVDWERVRAIAEGRRASAAVPAANPLEGATKPPATDEDRPHCGIGTQEVLVDPFGNVYPCVQVRWSAGNLHRQPIRAIWEQATAFGDARRLSVATAKRFAGQRPTQFGAPIFCPGVELTYLGERGQRTDIPLNDWRKSSPLR
ncbi:radical SAM protein [uncultured Thiodictyon sp.]|uniref:radical SAM protein n=1 Tax=uncultured Thiodictyon sp. TaxID=1846217 RepID=UPI0025F14259|nr:radical SAM protein [uncultured Thiodictyon sp.]